MLILPFLHLGYLITTFLALKRQKPTNKPAPFVKVGLKEPLGWQNCLCKGFSEPAPYKPSPNVFRDTFNHVRCGPKILGLSLVGLIIPSLTGDGDQRERKQVMAGGRIGGKQGSLHCRFKPLDCE